MSRIGRKPVEIPAGIEVMIDEGNLVTVKGPKGTLKQNLHTEMSLERDGNIIRVVRPTDEKEHRSLHGLTRTLLSNMVVGAATGFKKELEIVGVGFRAQKQGKQLIMNLGYSHQVIMEENEDIAIDVPGPNKIVISGADRQKVGQFAANVRSKRPPEPYKGKGIRYAGEKIRRKEGKAGGKKK